MHKKAKVLLLSSSKSLNGGIIQETIDRLKVEFAEPIYLNGDDEEELQRFLLGAGATSSFKERVFAAFEGCTGKKTTDVEVIAVDVNLPLGDTFKLGDYATLESLFPNLKMLALCCSNGRVLDVKMGEAALA